MLSLLKLASPGWTVAAKKKRTELHNCVLFLMKSIFHVEAESFDHSRVAPPLKILF